MSAEFKVVSLNEDEILQQLDDDLFFGDTEKSHLNQQAELTPLCAADLVVQAALQRALKITLPEGISGTMYRRGSKYK